jgi:hypothetical protein
MASTKTFGSNELVLSIRIDERNLPSPMDSIMAGARIYCLNFFHFCLIEAHRGNLPSRQRVGISIMQILNGAI